MSCRFRGRSRRLYSKLSSSELSRKLPPETLGHSGSVCSARLVSRTTRTTPNPAVPRHFAPQPPALASHRVSLVGEGDLSEPVSPMRFPDTRENTGCFPESWLNLGELHPETPSFCYFREQFPKLQNRVSNRLIRERTGNWELPPTLGLPDAVPAAD